MVSVGSSVKVRSKGERGTVLEVREGFARVLTQSGDTWYPLDELEEDLSLVDRLMKGMVDDGLDFILSVDAYRLLSEFKFNPYVLASSTKISIFPHQIDEVSKLLDNPRMLLADEVGLGKTITAGLVACELRHRGIANRLLFVVPKALLFKWRDELQQRFDLNVEILDSSYVKAYGNPFNRNEFTYVSSMDYLKQDHVLKIFDKAEIDITVVDEAHKMRKGNERFRLGEVLSEKSNLFLLLTATPHNGDDEEYLDRIHLLDPYVSETHDASYLLIRNMKEDVVDLEGKEVFPPRESHTVEVNISDEEKKVHRLVDKYISLILESARDKEEQSTARFLGSVFRKRASSSLRALRLTLMRRMEKLGAGVNLLSALKKAKEAEEEFDEKDYEEAEDELVGYAFSKSQEAVFLRNILKELDRLDGKDSKLERLLEFIRTLKQGDREAKIIVFSEYRDTVEYLFEALSKLYRVEKITGVMDLEARYRALANFRDPAGAEIMVCTDAAGEGIDMQFCNIMINYDLPWNPNRLEQRMGRIHRIGQRRKVYYYNFLLDGTIDGYIFSILLQRIEAIKKAMKDKVYDVLGRLIPEDAVAELYEELLKAPREEWEARVKKLDGILEERQRILGRIESLLVGHRLDRSKLEETKRVKLEAVDRGEVRRFVEVYLTSKGGKLEQVDPGREIYRIFLPKHLIHVVGRAIDTGSFISEIAQEKALPYFALGNRYVMAMIQDAAKPTVSVFKHQYLTGILFIYRVLVKDGRHQERDGRIVAVLCDGKNVREVDPRIVWDLEPVYGVQQESMLPRPSQLEQSRLLVEERVKTIVQGVKERCDIRLRKIRDTTRQIILEYGERRKKEIERRKAEFQKKLAEEPYYAGLIKRADNELQRLIQDVDKRLEDVEKTYNTYPVYELVGLAVVVAGDGADERKAVERAGIEAVMKYERDRARTVEEANRIRDVSDSYKGYDVESFDRVIEVKAFKETGVLVLTSHEWETAKRMGDLYWLYAVENALDNPKITPIKNPSETLKDKVNKIPVIDYRYIIEDWK